MFWENKRFFDKIWPWEHCGFRKLTLLTKYGYESIDFLVKIGRKKKDILLTFLLYSFDRMDVFGPIMGMTAVDFSWNIFKNEMKKLSFWESGRFFNKIRERKRNVFFEKGHFFDNTWAWEQIFFVKNRKKRTSYWLFWPIIIIKCSFDRINVFLTEYRYGSTGFFMIKLDKITWALCFWENGRFFDQRWEWEHSVFKRMDVFGQNMGMWAVTFT